MGTHIARRGLTSDATKNVCANENVSSGQSEGMLAQALSKAQASHQYNEHLRVTVTIEEQSE